MRLPIRTLLRPRLPREANSILKLGCLLIAAALIILVASGYIAPATPQPAVNTVISLLFGVGALIALYGMLTLLYLSRRPVYDFAISINQRRARALDSPGINTDSLPREQLKTVTESRAAVGVGFVCAGIFCFIPLLFIDATSTAILLQSLIIAGVGVILLPIGLYALFTYFRRRKIDPLTPPEHLELFARDNGFSSPVPSIRQQVHDTLGATRYIHGRHRPTRTYYLFGIIPHTTRDTRPEINFSIGGYFADSSFAMVAFDAVRPRVNPRKRHGKIIHKGAIIITTRRHPSPQEVEHIRSAVMATSPFAQDVISDGTTISIIFTDGIAIHKPAITHYFRLIQYVADRSRS